MTEEERLRACLEHEATLALRQHEMLQRRAGHRSPYAREAWRRYLRIREHLDPFMWEKEAERQNALMETHP